MVISLPSNCWRHGVSSVLILQPVTICNRDFLIFRGTRTVCVERFTATIFSTISQFVCFVAVAWDRMGVFWFSSARQTMWCSLFYLRLYQCFVFHRSRPTARGNCSNRPALCESERWIARQIQLNKSTLWLRFTFIYELWAFQYVHTDLFLPFHSPIYNPIRGSLVSLLWARQEEERRCERGWSPSRMPITC